MTTNVTQTKRDSAGTEECPDCGDEFDASNGQLISDFQYHRLRGCPEGGRS